MNFLQKRVSKGMTHLITEKSQKFTKFWLPVLCLRYYSSNLRQYAAFAFSHYQGA